MKAAIVEFPGSFAVKETQEFCQRLGIESSVLWFDTERLPEVELVILPSGASFADAIRPGALAAKTKVAGAVKAFARNGGKVLGIANGFQILCEIGLLPGVLLQNQEVKFKSVTTQVRYEGGENFLFNGMVKDSCLTLPFAAKFGAFYADKRTIQDIREQNLVLLRYVDQFATVDEENPFVGSLSAIAGLRNANGNVIGVMPRLDRLTELPFSV